MRDDRARRTINEVYKKRKIQHTGTAEENHGANPVKPEEELLENHRLQDGAIVCDLGSGKA